MNLVEGLDSNDEFVKSLSINALEMLSYDYLNKTREISKWAQLSGYDSVAFYDIKDNGGSNDNVSTDEESDIYIAFSPSQVKSADLVTYDDNGNVIPLSQRFNDENDDIRYSTNFNGKSIDNYTEEEYNNFGWINYNNVVPFDAEQRAFSNFADYKKRGFKFAETDSNEVVIPTGHSGKVDTFFLIDKDSDASSPKVNSILLIDDYYSDANNEVGGLIDETAKISKRIIFELMSYGVFVELNSDDFASYKSIVRRQERSNSTEIYFNSASKIGERSTERNKKRYVKEYIFDEAEDNTPAFSMLDMRRSTDADLVTYDDNGNVIPLSQRFNDQESDIRYSTEVVNLNDEEELVNRINGIRGANKYKIIQEYILEKLGKSIKLSDGIDAIIDKSDALHIANKSADKKTAEISAADKLVKNAMPYAEDKNVTHKKFNYFRYYMAFVKLGNKTFPIYLNVGKDKNGGTYHLYDITHKIKDTAHRFNDVERLQEFRSANDTFTNIVLQDNDISQANFSDKRKSTESIQSEIIRRATEANKTGNPQETIMNDTVEGLRSVINKRHLILMQLSKR